MRMVCATLMMCTACACHAHAHAHIPGPDTYVQKFCNNARLKLRFGPVKAVHLLINIHTRGRKCHQKANVGLLTRVRYVCVMILVSFLARNVGGHEDLRGTLYAGPVGASIPVCSTHSLVPHSCVARRGIVWPGAQVCTIQQSRAAICPACSR